MTFCQIIIQSIFHLSTEVNGNLFPTFSVDVDTAIFEIHIINIQPHTFRHTDTSAQKKR